MKRKMFFDEMLALWDKIEATIEGKPAISSPVYLQRYETESLDKYSYRCKHTSYHGLPSAIQDAKLAVFNRGTVSLKVPTPMDEIKADVDNAGANAAKFRAALFAEVDTYGVAWVRTDEPETKAALETEAQRKMQGVRPYAAIVSPRWVIDWTTDKFGKLLTLTQDLDEVFVDGEKSWPIYRLFTVDTISDVYEVSDDKGARMVPITGRQWQNTQTDASGAKVFPWVVGGCKKSRTRPGYYVSPTAAIADVACELFVRMSMKAYYFAKAAFSMLCGPASLDIMSAGDSKYIKLKPDDATPFWLTPPADLFEAFADDIVLLTEQIFVVARKKGMAALVGGNQAKSGAALSIEASEEESVVGSIAMTVHGIELQVWQYLAMRMSQNPAEVALVYPETWDVKTYAEELERLEGVAKLRNRDLYQWEAENFVRRKVANAEKQAEIIAAFESALNLRLEDVNVQALDTLVSLGVVSLADVARDVNPFYDTETTDDEIMSDVKANAAQVAEVKNELGMNVPVQDPVQGANAEVV